MRRILIFALVIGLFAATGAFAADATAGQADAPKAAKAPEPPAEGTLWRATVGEKFIKQTGIKVDFFASAGFAWNNNRNSSAQFANGSAGGGNNPNGEPGDTGFQLSQAQMTIHRDIVSNIIPRVTPTPGPVPNKFDYGFQVDTVYGRDGQPCRMTGWDEHWGVNEPGATNPGLAATNRQNFLCTPNVWGQMYLPFWKGIAITAGRYGDGLGYEIPPVVRPGPDFFWSHTYSFYSENWQVLGVLASVNLYRSEKNGYLAAEFGLNNGEQTFHSASGDTLRSMSGAVRWRSPHMSTWIDYAFRAGNGNVHTNAAGMPTAGGFSVPGSETLYLVQARTGQTKQRHMWSVAHNYKKWRFVGEGVYGKMSSDGKATTVMAAPPPVTLSYCGLPNGCPFTGASYKGVNGTVTYQLTSKLGWGFRMEYFNNPNGMFLWPLTAVKGSINDATVGFNYNPVKYLRLRPEIRYDWQTGNNGVKAFGTDANGKPSQSQIMAAMDMVVYF